VFNKLVVVHLLGGRFMHYEVTLFQFFQPHIRQETSIEQLATIWQCSSRYAKTIVQKLQQTQTIRWETSRGRGKKPYLTLLKTKQECVFELFKQYWDKEQYEAGYALLGEHELLNDLKIQDWLLHQYGIHQTKNAEQIFRYPFYDVNLTFDPTEALSRHDAHFIKQLHEPLFKENELTGEIEGNLLFHYETTDYQRWRFILRKGILFHNLKPLKASDVKYSLERIESLAKPYFDIVGIEIINDYELVFMLSKPFAILSDILTSFRTVVLPENQPDGKIGCGPFMLVEHSNKRLFLKTFERYFHTRPYIDGIEMIYTDQLTDFGISYIPYPNEIPQKKVTIQDIGASYIVLNCNAGPLQQKDLRETIYALIDPVQFVVGNNEMIASSWIPNKEVNTKFDAKTKSPPIHFPTLIIGYQQIRPDANYLDKALILQRQLEAYGISSELQSIDLQKTVDEINDNVDIYIGGVTIGKQKNVSLLNTYYSKPKVFFVLLDEENKKWLSKRLEQIFSNEKSDASLQTFQQIEHHLQSIYCLKFLTHRRYHRYIREDSIYEGLEFNDNGHIEYKKLY